MQIHKVLQFYYMIEFSYQCYKSHLFQILVLYNFSWHITNAVDIDTYQKCWFWNFKLKSVDYQILKFGN